jgi:hypothetical protein
VLHILTHLLFDFNFLGLELLTFCFLVTEPDLLLTSSYGFIQAVKEAIEPNKPQVVIVTVMTISGDL